MNNKLKFLIIFGFLIFGGLFLKTNHAEASSCTSAYPQSARTTATSGSFRLYASGVSGATYMYFATWNSINGQNDIVWYPATNAGGGLWYADINLATHSADGYGYVNAHTYMDGPWATWCGDAGFTIGRQPISSVDQADCTQIGGWTFDPDASSSSNSVDIYNNGTYYTSITTSGLRSDVNNAYGISGNHGWTLGTPGAFKDGVNHTINIYAIDLQGDGNPLIASRNVYCPPSASISASPTSIAYASSSTISWSSTNTSSCSVSPGGGSGTSGSFNTGALYTTTTYTVSCSGGSASASVTVTVGQAPPTCSSVTPDGTVAYGNTTQRYYANGVSGASSVLFYIWSNYGSGPSGQDDLVAIWGTNAGGGTWYVDENLANHVNTANSPGYGNVVAHVYMYNPDNSGIWCNDGYYSAIAPLAATISASPASVAYNGSSTLSWSSTSASTCSIGVYSGGPNPAPPGGTGGLSGSWTATTMTATITYFVSCNGVAGGNVGATATVTVAAPLQAYGYLDSNANSSNNNGNCSYLGGWAYDPDYADTAISIHIYHNGSFYDAVTANAYRGDLPGNHYHAFSYTIPSAWKDGANHTINMYAIDLNGNGNPNLVYSPITSLNCPPPTVSIKANGTSGSISINYNTAATLSWTTANATSCTLSPSASGVTGGTSNGGVSTGNLTAATTYTLNCTGPNGSGSGSVTININAMPSCTSATPDSDTAYNNTNRRTFANGVANTTAVYFATWSDVNGQDDLIWHNGAVYSGNTWYSDIPVSQHPGNGNINVHVYLVNSNYSYTWCDSANFTSVAPLAATISANPTSVAYNGSSVISWSSTSASTCAIGVYSGGPNPAPVNIGGLSGSWTASNMTATITYAVSCNGVAGGNVGNTVTVTVAPPPPTCTSATPDNDWTIATTGTRATYANGVANATAVYFATWSDPGGQDDIIWHSATNQGGGVWRFDIPLGSHPGLGNINVHVYMINNNYGNTWCDSATFTRLNYGQLIIHSGTPTTWTLTCPLTNCPTYTNPSYPNPDTDATYNNVPTSTWTITPANKAGYQVQVSPSNSQAGP